MNDYLMLNDLFSDKQDSIGFQLFKRSNVVKLNNNNGGNYNSRQIGFDTLNISNKMVNYSNAYIELELTISINYDDEETAKDSIPNEYHLKSSYEIVKSLRIMLNGTIISNEYDINRSNLVNYILNNGKLSPISHRNLNKATTTLTAKNNKFISKTNYASDDTKTHDIKFKFPIHLKDISNFFKNVGIINFGAFNINLSLIENIISIKAGREFTYKINNAHLIVEEIQLTDEDNIKYLKMLNNGYKREINYMENHVKTFNVKMNGFN